MKTPTTSLHHRQQKIHKTIIVFNTNFICQFILGNTMVKHIQGWNISRKLGNKHKVYVLPFLSAEVSR